MKYILRIVCALVVLFAADHLVGWMLKRGYETTRYGAIGRKNEIVNNIKSDIIILGSSRALHHYVPHIISDSTGMTCYNCGLGGQGIIYHYALLRAITQRYMPKMIVYEFTYEYDFQSSDNSRFLGEVRMLNHRGCSDSILSVVGNMERIKMLSAIYPYNSMLFHIIGDNLQRKNLTSQQGYIPKYGRVKPDRTNKGQALDSSNPDSIKLSFFEKMLREYSTKTKLVVMVSPIYATHNANAFSKIGELCRKYAVRFRNMSADSRFIDTDTLFCDHSHLNDQGAQLYTRSICGPLRQALRADQKSIVKQE